MVGELIMLPVRVGVRTTRLWFRAVEETVSVTTSATGRVLGLLGSRGSDRAAVVAPQRAERDTFTPAPPPESVRQPRPETAQEPAPTPAVKAPHPPVEPAHPPVGAAHPPVEPAHVSEEPALVEEFAEPGAEDGAGAEVHVDPPWDGYERMNAREIVARLGGADAAELAAVELYELTTRRRQTIVNAVKRELRRVNGSGSHRNQR